MTEVKSPVSDVNMAKRKPSAALDANGASRSSQDGCSTEWQRSAARVLPDHSWLHPDTCGRGLTVDSVPAGDSGPLHMLEMCLEVRLLLER